MKVEEFKKKQQALQRLQQRVNEIGIIVKSTDGRLKKIIKIAENSSIKKLKEMI